MITSEEKISTDEVKAAPAETVESDEELTPELEEEKFTTVKGKRMLQNLATKNLHNSFPSNYFED